MGWKNLIPDSEVTALLEFGHIHTILKILKHINKDKSLAIPHILLGYK